MTEKRTYRHISLVEMLMIVSLIAVVISLAIVFFDPIGRSSVSRNAERWNHVNAIASALYEYANTHEGKLPPEINEQPKEICAQAPDLGPCVSAGGIDLSVLSPDYLSAIPVDKMSENDLKSGYTVQLLPPGRLYVVAKYAEGGDAISISR